MNIKTPTHTNDSTNARNIPFTILIENSRYTQYFRLCQTDVTCLKKISRMNLPPKLLLESDIELEPTSSDYTVIHRSTPDCDEVKSPEGSSRGDLLTRNSPRSGAFKCSQCFKLIEIGRAVYMRNDFPYCSKECRELGVSSIYRVLFGSAVDNDAGFVTRLMKHIGGSSTSIASSIDSDDDDALYFGQEGGGPGVANAARARARSFLNSVMGSVSKTSLGSSFLRTYSNSVLWGKDMTRNTSFNMLFSYLPDIQENKQFQQHETDHSRSSTADSSHISPPT